MEATAIPPLVYQTYPVDILFRIYKTGARYEADLFAEGQFLSIPIDMSLHDLQVLNQELQQELRGIARANDASAEEDKETLRALAEMGHYALKRVFSQQKGRSAIRDLLGRSKIITIQIASEDFFLPWELFYTPSRLSEKSLDGP